MRRFSLFTLIAASSAFALSACGGGSEAPTPEATPEAAADPAPVETADVDPILKNGMTAAATIAMRQERYEGMGSAFRTINQQLRSGEPDLMVVQTSIASLPDLIDGMETWFPVGTGPEAGIETEALATIWEDKDDFLVKVAEFETAAAALVEAGLGGDLETIGAAVRATGATCGGCHDVYRLDD